MIARDIAWTSRSGLAFKWCIKYNKYANAFYTVICKKQQQINQETNFERIVFSVIFPFYISNKWK